MFTLQLWSAVLLVLPSLCLALPLHRVRERSLVAATAKPRGFEVPIVRRKSQLRRREVVGDEVGEAALGDFADFQYTISLDLGSTTTSAHLDTGSSDLWVISDACTQGTCVGTKSTKYDSSTFNATGGSVLLRYGDSTSGTQASGPVGYDTATLAGITIPRQAFAAVNFTDNTIVSTASGAAGIFGLAFPAESLVQNAAVNAQFGETATTDDFIASTAENGPLLSRLAMTGAIDQPLFTVTLQRDTVDIGGNDGALTVGRLPDGVDNSSLTWVPVKLYSTAVGGLQPPTFAPTETYPLRWEIEIDGVFLDGQRLADSTDTGTLRGNTVSALIDTGNSIMRGPSDVVDNILSTVSPAYARNPAANPTFPCATPHTLAFSIGGKQFPINPLDFLQPATNGDVSTCVASNVVATDPPATGATFSWSFGDPFFKSNLVAFYYGNLTHPSVDPPRIGFMSTVGTNTTAQLQQAIGDAKDDGGVFETTVELASSASAFTTVDISGTAAAEAAAATTSPAPTSVASKATAVASASAFASASASASSQAESAATLTTPTTSTLLVTIALLSTLSAFCF